jgi:hypothetical protein
LKPFARWMLWTLTQVRPSVPWLCVHQRHRVDHRAQLTVPASCLGCCTSFVCTTVADKGTRLFTIVKVFLSNESRPLHVIDRVAAFLPRGNGPIEPDAALHEFVWENERAARACAPGFIERELAARSGQCAEYCPIGAGHADWIYCPCETAPLTSHTVVVYRAVLLCSVCRVNFRGRARLQEILNVPALRSRVRDFLGARLGGVLMHLHADNHTIVERLRCQSQMAYRCV